MCYNEALLSMRFNVVFISVTIDIYFTFCTIVYRFSTISGT